MAMWNTSMNMDAVSHAMIITSDVVAIESYICNMQQSVSSQAAIVQLTRVDKSDG